MRFCVALLALLALPPAHPTAAGAEPTAEPRPSRESRRTPVVDVFERSRDAVINISTTRIVQMRTLGLPSLWSDIFDFGPPRQRTRQVHNIGSGVVIHPKGYAVTNAHVVAQASDVQVSFADGTTRPAEILAVDTTHDLAVIRIETDHDLPWQRLGQSDDVMVGETVVAIGNPHGFQHSVTAGIVSAVDRTLVFGGDRVYRNLIQTDAPINPGNSGGPLINVNNEVIGINTAIRGDAENMGFAIPVDRLWELLPEMLNIERRKRVKFGLRVAGPEAKVLDVRAGSPAEQAGLRRGDRVTKFNGEPIRDGIDYCLRLLDQEPDSEFVLGLQRGSEVSELRVRLEPLPLPDGRELALRMLGVELNEIPEGLQRQYGLGPRTGLAVTAVERGSPADRLGIEPGDIIRRIDGIPTADVTALGLLLEGVTPGEPVHVEVLRPRHGELVQFAPVRVGTR